MSRVFVSSDWHFNHVNICGPTLSSWNSGFRNFSSLNEMNKVIIDNINSVVMPEDEIRFLGDFAFGDTKMIPFLRSQIKCKNIHFIKGNHDEKLWCNYRDLFNTSKLYDEINYKGKKIVLFHYPIASWHKCSYSYHLFGHCHGSFTMDLGRAMDVGVDTNDFKPYLLDDVIDMLDAKPKVSFDHHGE